MHTKITPSFKLNLDLFGNSCKTNAYFSFILSEVSFFSNVDIVYGEFQIWIHFVEIQCNSLLFMIRIIIQSSKKKVILWIDFSFEVLYNLLRWILMQIQHRLGVIVWFPGLFRCFIKSMKIAFYDELLLMKYFNDRTKVNKVYEMLKSKPSV